MLVQVSDISMFPGNQFFLFPTMDASKIFNYAICGAVIAYSTSALVLALNRCLNDALTRRIRIETARVCTVNLGRCLENVANAIESGRKLLLDSHSENDRTRDCPLIETDNKCPSYDNGGNEASDDSGVEDDEDDNDDAEESDEA
jgi:hypothetical protein